MDIFLTALSRVGAPLLIQSSVRINELNTPLITSGIREFRYVKWLYHDNIICKYAIVALIFEVGKLQRKENTRIKLSIDLEEWELRWD